MEWVWLILSAIGMLSLGFIIAAAALHVLLSIFFD